MLHHRDDSGKTAMKNFGDYFLVHMLPHKAGIALFHPIKFQLNSFPQVVTESSELEWVLGLKIQMDGSHLAASLAAQNMMPWQLIPDPVGLKKPSKEARKAMIRK